MKKFVIFVLLAALLVVLVPAQAQGDEVTLTIKTVSIPGGCIINLEGVEEGRAGGFTAHLLGDMLLEGQFFEVDFQSDLTLYTVGWGIISYEGSTLYVVCPPENKDLYIFVNGTKILSAQNHEEVDLGTLETDNPTFIPPPELARLNELSGWSYVGTILPGEKTFNLTLSQ